MLRPGGRGGAPLAARLPSSTAGDPVDDPRISYSDVTRGDVLRSAVDRLAGLRDPGSEPADHLLDRVAGLEQELRDASALDYAAAKEGDLGRAVDAQRRMQSLHVEAADAWERLATRGTEVWHVVAALHRAAAHRDDACRAEIALYKLERP
ncbi:hypothetical protein GCM10009584_17910 [Ornithinimicrobium humiphilum]